MNASDAGLIKRPPAPDLSRLEALKARKPRPGEASFFYRDHHFKQDAVKVLPGEYYVTADDIVTICWTSGTEAQPKGVPRSHNEWLIAAPSIIEAGQLEAGARLLNPFPLVQEVRDWFDGPVIRLREPGVPSDDLECALTLAKPVQVQSLFGAIEQALGLRAWDQAGHLLYANPAFGRLVGWTPQELIAHNGAPPYWPAGQGDEFEQMRSQAGDTAAPAGTELQLQHRDGHRLDVLVHSAPLALASGEVVGWVGSALDITERRRVERLAARQQELLENYRGAIINGFADVEKALNSIRGLDQQRQWQSEELNQAQRAFEIAQSRYQAGAEDLLTVLETQRTLYAAQDQNVQLRLSRMQASIALYKALGGGWQTQ